MVATPPRTPPPTTNYNQPKTTSEADDSEFSYYEVIDTAAQATDTPVETGELKSTRQGSPSPSYEAVSDNKLETGDRETVIEGPVDMEGVYENIVVRDPGSGKITDAGELKDKDVQAMDLHSVAKPDSDVPVYQTIEHTTLIELKESRIGGD